MRTFWKILLGVVVALVVLGVIGFGIARHWMWNGRFAMWDRMPIRERWIQDDYEGEIPCEEEGGAFCEGQGFMPYGGFRGRGMHRTPTMHAMPGMVGASWLRTGYSPFTWLLLIAVIILGVLYFRQNKLIKQHMHQEVKDETELHQSELE